MKEMYVEITPKNIREIKNKSPRLDGKILICEPRYQSLKPNNIIDACIGLWNLPILDSDTFFHVERGHKKINGEDLQTNWENDRNYLLRPFIKPTGETVWDSCRELFDRLIIGSYEFEIGFQYTFGREIFAENGITLYIPKEGLLEPAFKRGLLHIVGQIPQTIEQEKLPQKQFNEKDIERIVKYVIKDYEDRQVFEHNIDVGLEADMLLNFN